MINRLISALFWICATPYLIYRIFASDRREVPYPERDHRDPNEPPAGWDYDGLKR